MPSVTGLSANIQSLLNAACGIERSLRRSGVSASALAAAFLVAEHGVFLARLGSMDFDREPFREEFERLLETPKRGGKPEQVTPPSRVQHIFVVHGHDDGAREAVARFLEKLGLGVIILHEQPDQGLTIIEKFEKFASQVRFAVVLLTPDDLGGAASATAHAARARQNVIFELGYLAAKLGRGRACLLRKGEVEIPSDLYGIIYTEMDAPGAWKPNLVKELKAAGLTVDANKVWA